MGRITDRRRIVRLRAGTRAERPDTLVVEEPLEVRVDGQSLAVTMRTPGHDFDLAAGFLVTEGVLVSPDDIAAQRYCAGAQPDSEYNIVDVTLAPGVAPPDPSLERAFYTTSSCGICGKASLDAVRTTARWQVSSDTATIAESVLLALPDLLRSQQAVFDRTGGLHAAGLFTAEGELMALREDVGRHNAVDKVIGWALKSGLLPLSGCVLQVSGRASFELTQKALMAGIPTLSAVSAPSSLAVDLAAEAGMTLAGFVRGDSMNIYTGAHRIVEPVAEVAG
ncbi:FdhD protein [Lipingzhangella halophila]|uniref:Sulfur carrier protein FdhD n=1 Tax=Lipingzhangella halophila TaxID=1783352 RepID=A0A7W7W3U9_9ACTN|nr:formate dehydrogenase accessory sulfurtransferase FdhD [Lipingzhangella halophila]MBB4933432.1 FdhD protein [Lipingzhangella halophila]